MRQIWFVDVSTSHAVISVSTGTYCTSSISISICVVLVLDDEKNTFCCSIVELWYDITFSWLYLLLSPLSSLMKTSYSPFVLLMLCFVNEMVYSLLNGYKEWIEWMSLLLSFFTTTTSPCITKSFTVVSVAADALDTFTSSLIYISATITVASYSTLLWHVGLFVLLLSSTKQINIYHPLNIHNNQL